MKATELLRLADAVEQVDPARFNMAKWWDNDCGCAIGWGHQFGALPAGLIVVEGSLNPTSFLAVASAFDLTLEQAKYLFDDEWYPEEEFPVITPADVARRIREVAGE